MQNLAVLLIVVVAAGYAAWQLMPQTLRRWLIGRLRVVTPSRRAWLARLEKNAESSGCGSCGGCSAGAPGRDVRRSPSRSCGDA